MINSPFVLKIMNDIRSNGAQPYFVGGCVRDYLLNIPCKDIDIEVFGMSYQNLQDLLQKYGKVDLIGKSFGIIKLSTPQGDFDFSLPRKDNKNGIGHKGFSVEVSSELTLEEAAARRDFTINSISMDSKGNLYDPYNGVMDIRNKILRPTSKAFVEDPLRALRAFQFSARFNMRPDLSCILDCNSMSNEYNTLSKERIWEEWKKWALKGKFYSQSIFTIYDLGWSYIYPELDAIYDVEQDSEFHPEGSVDRHTGYVLDHIAEVCERENITGNDRLVLVFTCLCHDFGKAICTERIYKEKYGREVVASHGHEKESGPLAKSFLESIGCPQEIIDRVIPLVVNHMVCDILSDKAIRKLSNRLFPATIRELVYVIEADHCGRPPLPKKLSDKVLHLSYRAVKLGVLDKKPDSIISGGDIVEFGYKPGPIVGKIYKKLYQMQLDGKFSCKREGLNKIQSFVKQLEG